MKKMADPFPASGISEDIPHGIYRWDVEGIGVYYGRFTGTKRPTKHYSGNVNRWLDGGHYRLGKPTKWRAVHEALKIAIENDLPITLTILEACEPDELNAREKIYRDKDATLNGRRGRRTVAEAKARLGLE